MHAPVVIFIVKFSLSIAETVQFSSGDDDIQDSRRTISTIQFEKKVSHGTTSDRTQTTSADRLEPESAEKNDVSTTNEEDYGKLVAGSESTFMQKGVAKTAL